jgi:hypothetical protein
VTKRVFALLTLAVGLFYLAGLSAQDRAARINPYPSYLSLTDVGGYPDNNPPGGLQRLVVGFDFYGPPDSTWTAKLYAVADYNGTPEDVTDAEFAAAGAVASETEVCGADEGNGYGKAHFTLTADTDHGLPRAQRNWYWTVKITRGGADTVIPFGPFQTSVGGQ